MPLVYTFAIFENCGMGILVERKIHLVRLGIYFYRGNYRENVLHCAITEFLAVLEIKLHATGVGGLRRDTVEALEVTYEEK